MARETIVSTTISNAMMPFKKGKKSEISNSNSSKLYLIRGRNNSTVKDREMNKTIDGDGVCILMILHCMLTYSSNESSTIPTCSWSE